MRSANAVAQKQKGESLPASGNKQEGNKVAMSSKILKGVLMLCLVSGTALAQGPGKLQSIDKVLAVVGDKIILQSDIEQQYAQYLQEQGNKPNQEVKCIILSQLLGQKLLVMQAEIDSLAEKNPNFAGSVENALQQRIDYFVRNYFGSVEELEEYWGKSIIQLKEDFRPEIRDQLKAELMQQEITADIDVSPADVKEYYDSMPQDSLPIYNTQVEIGQIVLHPKVTEAQKMVARTRLENLRAQIRNGADFKQLAVVHSDDPGSAYKGGDLGFVSRGQMVPEFEAAAFRLKKGELSQIVESEYGFHLIELLERRGEQAHVRHILIKPKYSDKEREAAVHSLDTIRQNILDKKISFAAAAVNYSDDKGTRGNGGMFINRQEGYGFNLIPLDRINEFTGDPGIFPVIDTMEVGQISEPLEFEDPRTREQAYRIIYYKAKSDPHRASYEKDYEQLKRAALAMQRQEKVEEWFQDKLKDQYIRIDEAYHNCEALAPWLEKAGNSF